MTSPTLTAGHVSDVGRQRKANEDCSWVPPPNFDPAAEGRMGALYLVADGMGGHQGGQRASQLAVSIVLSTFYSAPAADPRQSLDQALRMANAEILREAQSNAALYNMGTTMVAAVIQGSRLLIAHVGDSRAYRLRGGQLQQLTTDHSFVEEGMRSGEITTEQAAMHPYRGVITRSLGAKPDLQADYLELDWQPRDVLLLCSDGLTNMVTGPEIADILRTSASVQQAAQRLIDTANQQGGPDNITAVVVGDGQPATAAGNRLPLVAIASTALAVLGVMVVLTQPRSPVPSGAAVVQATRIAGEPGAARVMATLTASATLTATVEARAEGVISSTQTISTEPATVQTTAVPSIVATTTPRLEAAMPTTAPAVVQLSPPELTGPVDGWSSPLGAVTFTWNPDAGATDYVVETRSDRADQLEWYPWPVVDGGASSLRLDYETKSSYFQVPGTVYYWRVVPLSRGGQRGQPSAERSFVFRRPTEPTDAPESTDTPVSPPPGTPTKTSPSP